MKNSKSKQPQTCSKDHNKVCLSEAQALRRLERYQDIERYYLCEHCGLFHLTSAKNFENKHHEKEKPSHLDFVKDKEAWIAKRLERLINRTQK